MLLSLQCLQPWGEPIAVLCVLGESLVPGRDHTLPLVSFIVHGLYLASFKRLMVLYAGNKTIFADSAFHPGISFLSKIYCFPLL